VDGEGEDVRIAAQDRGGAVALVDVAVDDRHAAGQAGLQEEARGDSEVIESAVDFAVVGTERFSSRLETFVDQFRRPSKLNVGTLMHSV
jgi:hypothetical protein